MREQAAFNLYHTCEAFEKELRKNGLSVDKRLRDYRILDEKYDEHLAIGEIVNERFLVVYKSRDPLTTGGKKEYRRCISKLLKIARNWIL